ncbi:MAG: DUF4331 family protein [Novosphingobium sp.]
MTSTPLAALRRAALVATPLALALMLPACDGSDRMNPVPTPSPTTTAPTPSPTAPTPSPTPTPTSASRNVSACINQVLPNTNGRMVASLAVPDTLKLDFTVPNGFPNGRRFDDPVVDITLAALLLDLTRHPLTTLAGAPGTGAGSLNPPNDNTNAMATFPFLGPINGGAQPTPGTGTAFNFRTDPPSAYTRVDRMGNPAVGSIIGGSLKNAFNDGDPVDDLAGTFLTGTDGFINQLAIIHNGLFDDLQALGLTVCSTP